MHRRRRFSKLQWFEPLRLQRPPLRRVLKLLYPHVLRAVGLGIVASVVLHVALIVFFPAAAPLVPVVRYYVAAALLVPAMLLFTIGLYAVVPRHITLQRKRIVVVHGQSTRAFEGRDLQGWRIVALPNGDVMIRVTYSRRGQRRRVSFGVSRKVDLIEVERALRRIKRFGSVRATTASCA